MLLPRVMPCLLVSRGRLVKTIRFRQPRYVGDPVNAIKIYNEKEVDELVLLDIDAARSGESPNYGLVRTVADECFMPLCYGGGVRSVEQIEQLLAIGVEKVVMNTLPATDPREVSRAAARFGSQCIVGSIDVDRGLLGRHVLRHSGAQVEVKDDLQVYVTRVQEMGAGEILVNDVSRDGTWKGFDVGLLETVTSRASVPVIACGGAGSVDDIGRAVTAGGASAVAIGSMAVYQGKDLGVLINFPSRAALLEAFSLQG